VLSISISPSLSLILVKYGFSLISSIAILFDPGVREPCILSPWLRMCKAGWAPVWGEAQSLAYKCVLLFINTIEQPSTLI
jgi:hypothetical protein